MSQGRKESEYETKEVNYVITDKDDMFITVTKQPCVVCDVSFLNKQMYCLCFQISEGAECIMINKRFFLMNASITTLVQLKALVCT